MHLIRGFTSCLSLSRRGNWNSPGGIVPEFLLAAFKYTREDSSGVVILLPCQGWWLGLVKLLLKGHVHVLDARRMHMIPI